MSRAARVCPNPVAGSAYLGAVIFGSLTVVAVGPALRREPIAIALLVYVLAIVAVLWRAGRTGVYADADGLRIRRFWRSRLDVPWAEVDGFEVVRRRRREDEVEQAALLARGEVHPLPLVVRTRSGRGIDVDAVVARLEELRRSAAGGPPDAVA